jgi:hypothetical protein
METHHRKKGFYYSTVISSKNQYCEEDNRDEYGDLQDEAEEEAAEDGLIILGFLFFIVFALGVLIGYLVF